MDISATSRQPRSTDRRRLWDRRAGTERRIAPGRVDPDRRQNDRRVAASRRFGMRRRGTPTPYSSEEMNQLRQRFAAPGPVACPACGSRFSLGPGRRRGDEVARRVACLGCGRAAVIPNTRVGRVLVIGQHSAVREHLQAALGNAGHEVVEAADAAVGLLAYHAVPADVVVIDITAPGRLSFADFMRQLRRAYPEARVVAMSGRASALGKDPLAMAHGLGAVRTARLPMPTEELLRIIEEARM